MVLRVTRKAKGKPEEERNADKGKKNSNTGEHMTKMTPTALHFIRYAGQLTIQRLQSRKWAEAAHPSACNGNEVAITANTCSHHLS